MRPNLRTAAPKSVRAKSIRFLILFYIIRIIDLVSLGEGVFKVMNLIRLDVPLYRLITQVLIRTVFDIRHSL